MHGWGACMAGGMHGGGNECMAGGHACVTAGMYGMAWGVHGRGACMAWVHAWHGACMVGRKHLCMAGETVTALDGMYPTEMHSCLTKEIKGKK